MKSKKLTLGIVAHADAGKTTLSEAMLFDAKVIRKLGRVDNGDTALDTDDVEKRRGITIYSREARLMHNGVLLQFIDTPGHVDFGAEMERVLPVLDAAVLVISGLSGVENHTRTLWKLLKYYNIPAFIFVNKMDIARESREEIFKGLKEELSESLIDFSQDKIQIDEELAFCDDELFSLYTEKNELPEDLVRKAFSKREFFPVLYGSALKDDGVDDLMDLITDLAWEKETAEEFGAYCYKVTREGNTRLVHLKMTGGKLSIRDAIGDDKVTRIKFLNGDRQENVGEIEAGDVAAVEGLDHVKAGDALGTCEGVKQPLLEPVMSFQVIPPSDINPQQLYDDMKVLGEEDPSLRVEWITETKEVHIWLMGMVQLSVITEAIKTRFGYVVTFGPGRIMYKETITEPAEGIGHFEPLRHYAEVRLLLEPGEPESGIIVESECPTDILDKNYQQQILSTLNGYRHRGVLTGSQLTDVKITLVGGQASNKHTMGGDFRKATIRAVRQGLMKASSELLEPWYKITMTIKSSAVGRAMNDLMQAGGSTQPPDAVGDTAELTGEVPVSAFMEYSKKLIEYTNGPRDYSISNAGYRPCHNADEVITRSFYDPEMDSRNLPSSVFCFHGVGTNTPWYLVDSMAKSEPVLKGDDRVNWEYTSQVLHQAAESVEEQYEEHEQKLSGSGAMESHGTKKSSYQGYSGMSPELEEIFVREFGEIKRPLFNDESEVRDYDRDENIRTAKEDYISSHPGLAEKRRNENIKRRFLIVDGYNVIHASHELSQLFHANMDAARTKLVDEVENYQGFDGAETLVVFDAYNRKENAGRESKSGKVTVIYTKQDQTADAYIEKFTHDHRDRDSVRVVTSDNAEQTIAIGNGAIRVTAKEFLQELKDAHL
ncbi:MAG: TetM/TetW/TetO/TetS family tetracycline resistance ribosomal protection protein [Lachnospiraceae bacterium]|nr:TetM/TetW/TetO/TetS family tetracycline resistance ribosomal protection protein [Lachnospiraceae bacterium]